MDGIEVFYKKHSKEETVNAFLAAQKYGLLMSAGSDYHWDEQSSPGQYSTHGLKFDPKKIVKDFTE